MDKYSYFETETLPLAFILKAKKHTLVISLIFISVCFSSPSDAKKKKTLFRLLLILTPSVNGVARFIRTTHKVTLTDWKQHSGFTPQSPQHAISLISEFVNITMLQLS